jgi:hypothetical protein
MRQNQAAPEQMPATRELLPFVTGVPFGTTTISYLFNTIGLAHLS